MPVHNEAECIEEVLISWSAVLSKLGIRFRIVVVENGSTDGTRQILATMAQEHGVEVIENAMRGHGPALLTGYRRAVALAPWVFQCDSDAEMQPGDFPPLWESRHQFDGLFGVRRSVKRSLVRRTITAMSRAIVRWFFGPAVKDVNVPFRLLRSEWLAPILRIIPADTFAPNVMIAGAFSKWQLRVSNHPLRNQNRKTGTSFARQLPILGGALRSLGQIVAFRCRLGERPRSPDAIAPGN